MRVQFSVMFLVVSRYQEREIGRTRMAKPVYIQISKQRQWIMHQQRMGGQPG